jgi:hypothetical protein
VGALLLARRLVPDVRGPSNRRLDWWGFLLTAVGLGAIVVAMESAGSGAAPTWAATALVIGLVAGAAAIRHLRHARLPLLQLALFTVPTFRVTAAGGSVFRAVIIAVPFLLPLLFQLGFGWTAARAGLVVIALFVGNLAIKPLTTPLMRRFGIRPVLLGALAASAVALLGIGLVQADTPLPALLGLLVLSGAFRSIGFSAYNTVAFADVPGDRMTPANTLLSTLQELGGGLGVAVGALLVRLGDPLAAATGLGDGADAAFRVAFVLLAVVLLVPFVEALRLPRTAGAVVTGRR